MGKPKNTADELLIEAIKRIDGATADINSNITQLTATAAAQQVSLEEHMRRTEANEKHLELIESRVSPLEAHVSMWAGAGKVLAILGTLAGIAAAVYKVLAFYK